MNEKERFLAAMEETPAHPPAEAIEVPFVVVAMAGCNCGCGLPPRVTIDTNGEASLSTPEKVDALIDALTTCKKSLWPDHKKAPGIQIGPTPACECGCGNPAGVTLGLEGANPAVIISAVGVNLVIKALEEARDTTWKAK